MLKQKKKVDKIFLVIGLIVVLLDVLIFKSGFVTLGYIIGFIVVSTIMHFDVKRFEQSINMKIVLNLGIHILVYGITLFITIQISDITFMAATIILLAYRYTLLFMLKGKVE